MGLFDVAETMPTEGAIRGLTGEMVEVADQAITDQKVRQAPAGTETDATVGAIKRYLSQQGWGCKVKTVKGVTYWQVVEKKEITPEHKAKMLAALEAGRQKRDAAKAATAAQTTPEAPANGNGGTPAETPAKAQQAAKKG